MCELRGIRICGNVVTFHINGYVYTPSVEVLERGTLAPWNFGSEPYNSRLITDQHQVAIYFCRQFLNTVVFSSDRAALVFKNRVVRVQAQQSLPNLP